MTEKNDSSIEKRQIPRADQFANFTTGLAGPVDKSQYVYYQRFPTLYESELSNMYEQNSIAARIVDRLVDDATREGFKITGDDPDFDWQSLMSDLEDFNLPTILKKAWKQARLYGGALIVMRVNDTKRYDEPLDWKNLTNLIDLHIIPSYYAVPTRADGGIGPLSYINPDYYQITTLNGKQKRIHASRCIRLEGIPDLSDRRKLNVNYGWGPSVLQRVYREVSNLGQVEGYLANIMHEASVLKWSIEGLYEQLCGAEGQKSDIQKMVEQSKGLMDILHVLLVDSKDDVSNMDRDVSGLDKILDKFVDALVRATSMPRLILLGEQPGGINNSADGEVRGWYDSVHAEQKNYLTPLLNSVLRVIFKVRENKGFPIPKKWSIVYNPLWQPTGTEKSKSLLETMQAYQIAIDKGFIKKEEVREMLISDGTIQNPIKDIEPEETSPEPLEISQDEDALPSTESVPPDLVSTREAASHLGVPTLTINNLCRSGKLRYWMFGSRRQVSMADVMKAGKPE